MKDVAERRRGVVRNVWPAARTAPPLPPEFEEYEELTEPFGELPEGLREAVRRAS